MVAWLRKGHERIPCGDGTDLLLFQLGYMSEPTEVAVKNAKSGGMHVWDQQKNKWQWKGASTKGNIDLSTEVFLHGTTPQNAADAILDGGLKPSTRATCKDPICGVNGVYFIRCKSLAAEDILEAWRRLAAGGYLYGAMFVTRLHGTIIQGNQSLEISPGVISVNLPDLLIS